MDNKNRTYGPNFYRDSAPLTKARPVLGKKGFIYRYPRAFTITTTFFMLGVFFSKPIYDFFVTPSYSFDFSEPDPRSRHPKTVES